VTWLGRGEVTVASGVPSPAEGCARTLRIYVPSAIRAADAVGVVVMLDGQNCFARSRAGDFGTWAADDALDALVAAGDAPPLLAVAVDHRGGDRIGDCAPWPDRRVAAPARGERFADFLVGDLFAWMGAHLPARALEWRALCGSSLGGLAALFVAWRTPPAYGAVAALSPTVMWADGELARRWSRRADAPPRMYVDAGERERFDAGGFELDYGGSVRDFGAHLRRVGHGPDELRVELDPRGAHDEASWARRFPDALRWLVAGPGPVR
jgi:enterochelin esterase-like enzyme